MNNDSFAQKDKYNPEDEQTFAPLQDSFVLSLYRLPSMLPQFVLHMKH